MLSEARKKANKKYIAEKTDDIRLRVKKGTKERYQKEAETRGISMTKFIVDCVEREITDPFYSAENMAELERRIETVRSGKSTLKEHELIEVDE